jgi:hypothetical protein
MKPLTQPVTTAIFGALLLMISTPLHAATWSEVGDAGDLLLTSQSTIGASPLSTITGTLPTDADVDLFKIQITDKNSFYAAIQPLAAIADPDIWLFDSSGIGIAHNATVQGGACSITSALVPSNGTYYLGVSSSGALAQSAGGDIWNGGNFAGQYAPDGAGAAQPLTGWGGTPMNDLMNYSITLTGADFATPAPEPSSAGFATLILAVSALGRRRITAF